MTKQQKCSHGYSPDSKYAGYVVWGGDRKAVAQHFARCKAAVIFWHPGLLVWPVLCCATCKTKLR